MQMRSMRMPNPSDKSRMRVDRFPNEVQEYYDRFGINWDNSGYIHRVDPDTRALKSVSVCAGCREDRVFTYIPLLTIASNA